MIFNIANKTIQDFDIDVFNNFQSQIKYKMHKAMSSASYEVIIILLFNKLFSLNR